MTTRDQVEAINTGFSKAVANHDAAAIASNYTEDARMLPPNAPMIQGRAGIQEMFQTFIDGGVQSLELESIDVLEDGALVVDVGRWALAMQPPGADPIQDTGKYVVVLRRQSDGGLKIAVDTFNSDNPA